MSFSRVAFIALLLPFSCTPPVDEPDVNSNADVIASPDVRQADAGAPDAASADVDSPDVNRADAIAPDVEEAVDAGVADVVSADVNAPDVVPPSARLVINEVMPRNTSTLADEAGEFDDWVEIYNAGDAEANLSGYVLTDNGMTPSPYTFPADVFLGPQQYLVLFADIEPLQGIFHLPFKLSGTGETLSLSDPDGVLVDEFTYLALAEDQAGGRTPDGEGEVVVLQEPTPRAANSGPFQSVGTPVTTVVINEFVASNATGLTDELLEFDDWIELFNTGDAAQDLSGHHLSDRAEAPFLYTFPGGTVLSPGAYLIVFADGSPAEGPFHADFSLSANGESIVLSAPDGSTIERVDFGAQLTDEAAARSPNGTGAFAPNDPTPGAANP